ncbi:ribonuclease H [Bifidobacterium animalis subsp. animalis]|nr:ribonuclease H [Bifidobacterium animalis subsp. animalis]
MTITVSTDGSALRNPNGPMGWAWADHTDGERAEHAHAGDCAAGGATNGTNQIGELCAVLEALRAHPGSEPLVIESDSQYAINCSSKWVFGWKKNGWKNSKQEPVKNAPIIKAIDAEISKRAGKVSFRWVKGHAGNAGNEKVDDLARGFAGDCESGAQEGYLPKEGWQALLESPYARDVKVPADARLLLDGELSEEEYTKLHAPAVDELERAVETGGDQTTANTTESAGTPDDMEEREPDQSTADTSRSNDGHARNAGMQLAPTGLVASGRVTLSPPPNSSPYYDGSPRRIHGYIEVDALVQGDGTLDLENARFLMHRRENGQETRQ